MAECLKINRGGAGGSSIPIVSWQNGTSTELALMLAAHDSGLINIYDYWKVGDTRSAHLNYISSDSYGFPISMAAQDVEYVIMDTSYPGTGNEGIHFVIGQKDLLNQNVRLGPNDNTSTYWNSNAGLYKSLHDSYYNAMSDNKFKELLKDFYVTSYTYSYSPYISTTKGKFALFAEKEILGTRMSGNYEEANALTQIKYYETTSNRAKHKGSTEEYYWTRSCQNYSLGYYISIYGSLGNEDPRNGSLDYLFSCAPFFCI